MITAAAGRWMVGEIANPDVLMRRSELQLLANKMYALRENDDLEIAHIEADDILIAVIAQLAEPDYVEVAGKIINAYEKIDKWHA